MPGTWIKWTKGLPNKPEVIRLAGLLRTTREAVVCRLMSFWEWCDDTIPTENVRPDGTGVIEMSPSAGDNAVTVDAIVGVSGFALALSTVGWAQFSGADLEIPNFGRHNGETAKTRARNSLNQKKIRDSRNGQVPPPIPPSPPHVTKMSPPGGDIFGDKTVTRGEEIREEEERTPQPPAKPGEMGAVEPPSAKKPRRPKTDMEGDPLFLRFWEHYPRKVDKPDASRAFSKLKVDESLLDRILTGIEKHKRSEQWQKGGGEYIKYPGPWLRARGWEDEPVIPSTNGRHPPEPIRIRHASDNPQLNLPNAPPMTFPKPPGV